MTQDEFVKKLASNLGVSQARAKEVIYAFKDTLIYAMSSEDRKVCIRNFGTFKVVEVEARKGRNPRTGETIDIPATTVVKFKESNNWRE